MHVLLTRPYNQSIEMKRQLEEMGCRVSIEPVLKISQLSFDNKHIKASNVLILTSYNASKIVANIKKLDKEIRIFAVGKKTAEPFLKAGFKNVSWAAGDAESLLSLVTDKVGKDIKSIFYVSGKHVTKNLANILNERGYKVRRVIVYNATPVKAMSKTTKNMIKRGDIDYIAFMSYRTAFYFNVLVRKYNMQLYLNRIKAITLSPKVARGLQENHWKSIDVATAPSNEALFEHLSNFL